MNLISGLGHTGRPRNPMSTTRASGARAGRSHPSGAPPQEPPSGAERTIGRRTHESADRVWFRQGEATVRGSGLPVSVHNSGFRGPASRGPLSGRLVRQTPASPASPRHHAPGGSEARGRVSGKRRRSGSWVSFVRTRRVTGDITCCAGVPGRVAARPCSFRFPGAAGDAGHRCGWISSTFGKYVRNRATSRVSSLCPATSAWAPM